LKIENKELTETLLTPDEPAPFEILNADALLPVLLVCDHASNRFPRSLRTMGLDYLDRVSHIALDIGAGAVAKALACQTRSRVIAGNNGDFAFQPVPDFDEKVSRILISARPGLGKNAIQPIKQAEQYRRQLTMDTMAPMKHELSFMPGLTLNYGWITGKLALGKTHRQELVLMQPHETRNPHQTSHHPHYYDP